MLLQGLTFGHKEREQRDLLFRVGSEFVPSNDQNAPYILKYALRGLSIAHLCRQKLSHFIYKGLVVIGKKVVCVSDAIQKSSVACFTLRIGK